MLEKHLLLIAFCDHSWKPFFSEEQAIDFIKEQEKLGELWSITTGKVTFNSPDTSENPYYEMQDLETIKGFTKVKTYVHSRS